MTLFSLFLLLIGSFTVKFLILKKYSRLITKFYLISGKFTKQSIVNKFGNRNRTKQNIHLIFVFISLLMNVHCSTKQ